MLQYLRVIGLYVNRCGSTLKNIRSTDTVTGNYTYVVVKWIETGSTGQYFTRRQWTALTLAMQLYIFILFVLTTPFFRDDTLLNTQQLTKTNCLIAQPYIQISDWNL
jgi:hypothetical protein